MDDDSVSGNTGTCKVVNDEMHSDFVHAMEMQGLRYFAGYIAYKFLQHSLDTHVQPGENTWNEVACRKVGALMTPTSDFFEKISHGEASYIIMVTRY